MQYTLSVDLSSPEVTSADLSSHPTRAGRVGTRVARADFVVDSALNLFIPHGNRTLLGYGRTHNRVIVKSGASQTLAE